MALAERLAGVQPRRSTREGCRTCIWLGTLDAKDRDSFQRWVSDGHPLMQLYYVCKEDEANPIPVSYTSLRNHVKANH